MAKTTISVSGEMYEKFCTKINCSHEFFIDQPIAAGGEDKGPNPLEVFLSTLPACICAIGRIISNQKKLNVRSIKAKVEGDIDKNYLLGATEEGRAGFTEIRTFVEIDADMTTEEKQEFLNEIARRCPIADNMKNTSQVVAKIV